MRVTFVESTTSLLPVIPIYGSHFAGSKVTPPEEGPSQPLKATQATRGPEEELGKSREELRVIHDNHSGIMPELLPVPIRTSAMTRTITRSKGQKLQVPPSQWAKFCVTRRMRAATWQQFSWRRNQPEPLPDRTTDGCCYNHFKTSFKPDGRVGAGGG